MASSRDVRFLDLLKGQESYKLRWSSRVVPIHRVILGRRRVSWLPYARYQALHSSARRYALSEGAPPWVKSAADGYRALRAATRNRKRCKQ